MLHLHVLGGLSLSHESSPQSGAGSRHRLAILAVLAAGGDRGISRDRLLALFWPESDAEHARSALRQALYVLRRDFQGPDLILGPSELRLNPAVLRTDLDDFIAALTAHELERAVACYGGPFLDGIFLSGLPAFESWVDSERRRLAERHRISLWTLATNAEANRNRVAALRWWKQLAATDPLNAEVTQSLMRAHATLGDAAGALQQAQFHARVLRDELDAPPDLGVLALAGQIRAGNGKGSAERTDQEIIPVLTSGEDSQPVAATAPPPAQNLGFRMPVFRWRAGWAIALAALVVVAAATVAIRQRGVPLELPLVMVVAEGPSPISGALRSIGAEVRQTIASAIGETGLAVPIMGRTEKAGNEAPGTSVSELVAIGKAARARFVVAVGAIETDAGVGLAAAVVDVWNSQTVLTAPAMRGGAGDWRGGLKEFRSRILAALALRLDPEFEAWSRAASGPIRYESYLALGRAFKAARSGDWDQSQRLLRTAAKIDTVSATPLVLLAFGKDGAALDSVLSKLDPTGRRLGAWDQEMLGVIQGLSRDELAEAHRAAHRLFQLAPEAQSACVVGLSAYFLRRAAEAIRVLRDLDPEGSGLCAFLPALTSAYHLVGDYTSELSLVQGLRRKQPDDRGLIQLEVRALAGIGRIEEVAERCAQGMVLAHNAETPQWQPCIQAIVELRAHGHAAAAHQVAVKLLASLTADQRIGSRDSSLDVAELWIQAGELGEAERALGSVRPAAAWDAGYVLIKAQVAAWRGDRVEAEALLEWLSGHQHEVWGGLEAERAQWPFFQAVIAAHLGDRDRAVSLLAQALREGWRWGTLIHNQTGFARLRGYAPFEALMRPLQDDESIR